MPIVLALGAALVGGLVAANMGSKSTPQKAAPPPQAAANPQSFVLMPIQQGNAANSVNNLVV